LIAMEIFCVMTIPLTHPDVILCQWSSDGSRF